MVCPYHAWTDGQDGKLIGVARADMFDGLAKDQRGLKELPSTMWGGLVYQPDDPDALRRRPDDRALRHADPRARDHPQGGGGVRALLDLIIKVFGGEDFRAAQISQAGLAAGVPERTVYCGLETNVIRYYEAIEALL